MSSATMAGAAPESNPRRVVLFSGHYYGSRRRAGFHWMADAFWRAGYDVIFVTTQISWISRLRGDRRFEYPIRREARRLMRQRERFRTFIWFTAWHPANLRFEFLNRLTSRVARRYGDLSLGRLEPELREASIVVFESDLGLFLVPRVRRIARAARFIYRVSDDLRLLRNHPEVLRVESEYAPEFDVISSPSRFIHERFAHLPNAALHHHGVQKDVFDGATENPYQAGSRNAIYVGTTYVDLDFFERASRLFPEVRFHVFGPIAGLPERANVVAYGERPFRDTVPYVKFATVGLQTRSYEFGAESLTDSLKVLQYTYCRLPIVAPAFLRSSRANLFTYTPGDDGSIRHSMNAALAMDRWAVDRSDIRSWDELVTTLAGNVRSS